MQILRLRFPETVGGLMQFANPGEFADDCPATWVVKLVSHTPTNARISSNNDRRTVLGNTSQFPCMSGLIPTISMPDTRQSVRDLIVDEKYSMLLIDASWP